MFGVSFSLFIHLESYENVYILNTVCLKKKTRFNLNVDLQRELIYTLESILKHVFIGLLTIPMRPINYHFEFIIKL